MRITYAGPWTAPGGTIAIFPHLRPPLVWNFGAPNQLVQGEVCRRFRSCAYRGGLRRAGLITPLPAKVKVIYGLNLWGAISFRAQPGFSSPELLVPLLRACHLHALHVSCNSAVRKLLIRLGKSLFLESGKATTRVKRRITAAFEGTGPRTASPRGHSEENSAAPLKLAEA